MKTDEYPVEMDGHKFHIQRTFGGEPAIYRLMGDGRIQHISESPNQKQALPIDTLFGGMQVGDDRVIILADLVE